MSRQLVFSIIFSLGSFVSLTQLILAAQTIDDDLIGTWDAVTVNNTTLIFQKGGSVMFASSPPGRVMRYALKKNGEGSFGVEDPPTKINFDFTGAILVLHVPGTVVMMKRPSSLTPVDGTTECGMVSGQLHCDLRMGAQLFTLHFTEDFVFKNTINGKERAGALGALVATRSGVIHGEGFTRAGEDYTAALKSQGTNVLVPVAPAVYIVKSQSMEK